MTRPFIDTILHIPEGETFISTVFLTSPTFIILSLIMIFVCSYRHRQRNLDEQSYFSSIFSFNNIFKFTGIFMFLFCSAFLGFAFLLKETSKIGSEKYYHDLFLCGIVKLIEKTYSDAFVGSFTNTISGFLKHELKITNDENNTNNNIIPQSYMKHCDVSNPQNVVFQVFGQIKPTESVELVLCSLLVFLMLSTFLPLLMLMLTTIFSTTLVSVQDVVHTLLLVLGGDQVQQETSKKEKVKKVVGAIILLTIWSTYYYFGSSFHDSTHTTTTVSEEEQQKQFSVNYLIRREIISCSVIGVVILVHTLIF